MVAKIDNGVVRVCCFLGDSVWSVFVMNRLSGGSKVRKDSTMQREAQTLWIVTSSP